MAGKHLAFWFDYSCPFAYLGSTQVEALAKRMGAELTWEPMLLGAVLDANGMPHNLAASVVAPKAMHNALDTQRWAELYGAPLRVPNGHPIRTVDALRATIATGCDPKVIHGFYRAYWAEGRPFAERATLESVLSAAGHEPAPILERIARPEAKDELRRRTDRALALGIFGAPSYVVDGERLYWGQDRAHFVAGVRWDELLPPLPATKTQRALDFYWDFSSPFSYLASTQAESLTSRNGAKLVWRPMLLGGLFKMVGQPMVPMQTWSEAKQRHGLDDLKRWASYWEVPFTFPSRFPLNSLKAMRCYLALPDERRAAFRERTYRACWAEDRDIADVGTLRELVGEGADEVLARTETAEVKQGLIDATKRAADAGAFGAPTWVVDGREVFWGQDRIPLVERALRT